MQPPASPTPNRRPPAWAYALAFGLVYLGWGTTYLAIKAGVGKDTPVGFPPALFGGTRIVFAGLVILGYLALRGEPLRMSLRDLAWTAVAGALLFVGGNFLITLGQRTIDSSLAAVLVALTPLLMALMETCWPGGDRLSGLGWLGLLVGLAGVFLLFAEELFVAPEPGRKGRMEIVGMLLVIGSAATWALGTLVMRYRRPAGSHLATAAYQMILGGGGLLVIAVCLGEPGQVGPEDFTPRTVYAYFHLLIVGSLIGFIAYTWLLKHTSATMAGTYAYVNPLVAILAGWLIDREPITLFMVAGMAVILVGVATVRLGGTRTPATVSEHEGPVDPEEVEVPSGPVGVTCSRDAAKG